MTTARTKGRFRWDVYREGAWFTCDRCSQRWRRSKMITEWDGLKVCPPCLDPRPPQMTPPNIYPEGIPFPDARPPQDNPDRLFDDSYLVSEAGLIDVTDGVYPVLANGQKPPIGAYSPRQIQVDSIPKEAPSANQVADDITLRTGPIYAPSVLPTDPSPGPIPGPPVGPIPPDYT
jgi:hypothetical protein